MAKKKETFAKTKKTTKKEIKGIKQEPTIEETKIEEEVLIATDDEETQLPPTTQVENESIVNEEAKEEIVEEKKVDEIHEAAIKETFKENNTRLIDRTFGYSWNGQEIEY